MEITEFENLIDWENTMQRKGYAYLHMEQSIQEWTK